jgi:hypothetical protein
LRRKAGIREHRDATRGHVDQLDARIIEVGQRAQRATHRHHERHRVPAVQVRAEHGARHRKLLAVVVPAADVLEQPVKAGLERGVDAVGLDRGLGDHVRRVPADLEVADSPLDLVRGLVADQPLELPANEAHTEAAARTP